MMRILFVCHGNICRSPMAEFIMKDILEKLDLTAYFEIASAATGTEELGNPVYPASRRQLESHGISCAGKTARQLRRDDYQKYNLLIGMDSENIRDMTHICGGDPQNKIHKLKGYAGSQGEVADPWYTGDFDTAWQDIDSGCRGLLDYILNEYGR